MSTNKLSQYDLEIVQQVKSLQQQAKDNPENFDAWVAYGDFVVKHFYFTTEALNAFKHAGKLRPNWDCRLRVGNALVRGGKEDEGIEVIQASLADRQRPTAYIYLATAYAAKEMVNEAIEACYKVLEMDDQYEEAYYLLGTYYIENELGKAIAFFRKAIEIDPDYQLAWSELGASIKKMGKSIPEAITTLQRAIELNPEDGWALAHLGNAFVQCKQWEEAEAIFQQACQVYPEEDYIKECYDDCIIWRSEAEAED